MLRHSDLNRRTKIIATLGPASSDAHVLQALLQAGVDMVRINASHSSDPEEIQTKVQSIRSAAKAVNRAVGIMLDLQGPKIRVGKMVNDAVTFKKGDRFKIVSEPVIGTRTELSVSYPNLAADVKPGEMIYVDDGKIHLRVIDTDNHKVNVEVVQGGTIGNKKGVNLPHTQANISPLTTKDIADAIAGVAAGIDYIALSFVSQASDVQLLRQLLTKHQGDDIRIIAKIERQQAIQNIGLIADAADAIMVARGDLGVEIELPNVPKAQKMIIQEANQRLKPVIVATQMLESMILSLSATRAEVSDVANAIYDECDAVMLSGETATGIDPVNVVRVMSDICAATDRHMMVLKRESTTQTRKFAKPSTAVSICAAADRIADENNAAIIMSFTSSGSTPLIASKFNPSAPIVAPTDNERVCQRMSIYRGVLPMMMPRQFHDISRWTDMIHLAVQEAIHQNLVSRDETIVVTAGIPIGESNGINSIRVITA